MLFNLINLLTLSSPNMVEMFTIIQTQIFFQKLDFLLPMKK